MIGFLYTYTLGRGGGGEVRGWGSILNIIVVVVLQLGNSSHSAFVQRHLPECSGHFHGVKPIEIFNSVTCIYIKDFL